MNETPLIPATTDQPPTEPVHQTDVKPPLDATIIVVEKGDTGAHYRVRLLAVPQVDDWIHLYSTVDDNAGVEPHHYFSDRRVCHEIVDVADHEGPELGHHSVEIYVKPAKVTPQT